MRLHLDKVNVNNNKQSFRYLHRYSPHRLVPKDSHIRSYMHRIFLVDFEYWHRAPLADKVTVRNSRLRDQFGYNILGCNLPQNHSHMDLHMVEVKAQQEV